MPSLYTSEKFFLNSEGLFSNIELSWSSKSTWGHTLVLIDQSNKRAVLLSDWSWWGQRSKRFSLESQFALRETWKVNKSIKTQLTFSIHYSYVLLNFEKQIIWLVIKLLLCFHGNLRRITAITHFHQGEAKPFNGFHHGFSLFSTVPSNIHVAHILRKTFESWPKFFNHVLLSTYPQILA